MMNRMDSTKKHNCQDHISSENWKLTNLDTYTCFVDFKKAFVSIPRELLWHKLTKIGIRGKLLKSIKALYTNLHSSVKFNDKLSPAFEIGHGVKQGCTLSPTHFNIFINDLIEYLNEAADGICMGNYKSWGKQECPNCCPARRYGMSTIVTKISCIRFWLRLSKMSHSRLNYKIFPESCRLAGNG